MSDGMDSLAVEVRRRHEKTRVLVHSSRGSLLFFYLIGSRSLSSDVSPEAHKAGGIGPGIRTNEDVAWPRGLQWHFSGASSYRKFGARDGS